MAATKARRMLIANKDCTHSLTIELARSSFFSQFETSFQRFRNDTLARNIPEKAFKPSDIFTSLLLGRLKLESLQRREQFAEVLHSLDYSKLIGPAPESAQSSSIARENIDTARSLSHVAPLRINISGLTTDFPDPSVTRKLWVGAVDPTGRLHPFLRSLIAVFTMAGFPILKPFVETRMIIVNLYVVIWDKPCPFVVLPNGRRYYKRDSPLPRFDARDLLKKYENEIWAKDVRLERLGLRGVGATERNPDGKKVFKDAPEVDSVALP